MPLPGAKESIHVKTNKTSPLPRVAAALVVASLAWLAAGCSVATSTQPIGSKPVPADSLHLDGTWRGGGGDTFFVRTVDDSAGRLEVATVKTNREGFSLERLEVLLRQHADIVLANIRSRDPEPAEDYSFGRLTVVDNTLILTLAPASAIRRLALDGVVQATVTTNRDGGSESYAVRVTGDFDRLAERLAAPDGWQWLDTANPIVLTRQR
ncbi:MAG: hypothetical protein JNL97_06955 [Verrucomicrobiales bacterium]|nr:hypothetical protein [Verrucomicrobiales bacterium]